MDQVVGAVKSMVIPELMGIDPVLMELLLSWATSQVVHEPGALYSTLLHSRAMC